MRAPGEILEPATDRRPGRVVISIHPAAWLAFGGVLTVAWIGALALCAYNIVDWLAG